MHDPEAASSENLCSKPTGKPNGTILGKILSREVEYELVRDEISALLQSSSDPASLVLDTLKYTDPSNSREFIRLGIPIKHCILLLDHLKRFSPIINPQLSQEAKQFCTSWKLKLKAGKDDHMETICFLQFLAAFKLAPLVSVNEVLNLLDPSKWAKQVPDSCESLGLAEFLPGKDSFLLPRFLSACPSFAFSRKEVPGNCAKYSGSFTRIPGFSSYINGVRGDL